MSRAPRDNVDGGAGRGGADAAFEFGSGAAGMSGPAGSIGSTVDSSAQNDGTTMTDTVDPATRLDGGRTDADSGGGPGAADAPGGTDGGVDIATGRQFRCPAGPFPAPIAGSRQSICDTFKFRYNYNEGPTWVTSQNAFFFSNYFLPTGAGDIVKYTPGGECQTFIPDAGCNGLAASSDGNIVAACQVSRAVVEYDVVTKQPKTLANIYMGQMLDSPNDVVTHHDGAVYFTNPTYDLDGRPQGVGRAVFRLDPLGNIALIAEVGNQPNGIALSPDEARLYVELDSSGVEVYDLDAAGVPSAGPRGFSGPTDGMAVDCAGNVYLSGGTIISPDGKQIGTFPGGTNLAFGGPDGKILFVVGGGTGVYRIQMNVPGLP